ncbi:hypothetical protein GCM10025874_20980 [Arenivirga flava]|uniref:Uncharacterized protein n=1 Tax=Arenivirga flava TaxID=1930060 RepID=A0AA37XBW7_9MICO|nr:hypothetical protein GCM10025874_20980 [Arenivirga flava]
MRCINPSLSGLRGDTRIRTLPIGEWLIKRDGPPEKPDRSAGVGRQAGERTTAYVGHPHGQTDRLIEVIVAGA